MPQVSYNSSIAFREYRFKKSRKILLTTLLSVGFVAYRVELYVIVLSGSASLLDSIAYSKQMKITIMRKESLLGEYMAVEMTLFNPPST
jgi:hypothetical protein